MTKKYKILTVISAVVFAAALAVGIGSAIVSVPHEGKVGDINEACLDVDYTLMRIDFNHPIYKRVFTDYETNAEIVATLEKGVWKYVRKEKCGSVSRYYTIRLYYEHKDEMCDLILYENGIIEKDGRFFVGESGIELREILNKRNEAFKIAEDWTRPQTENE